MRKVHSTRHPILLTFALALTMILHGSAAGQPRTSQKSRVPPTTQGSYLAQKGWLPHKIQVGIEHIELIRRANDPQPPLLNQTRPLWEAAQGRLGNPAFLDNFFEYPSPAWILPTRQEIGSDFPSLFSIHPSPWAPTRSTFTFPTLPEYLPSDNPLLKFRPALLEYRHFEGTKLIPFPWEVPPGGGSAPSDHETRSARHAHSDSASGSLDLRNPRLWNPQLLTGLDAVVLPCANRPGGLFPRCLPRPCTRRWSDTDYDCGPSWALPSRERPDGKDRVFWNMPPIPRSLLVEPGLEGSGTTP